MLVNSIYIFLLISLSSSPKNSELFDVVAAGNVGCELLDVSEQRLRLYWVELRLQTTLRSPDDWMLYRYRLG
ncbi:hypothetical protein KSF78_0004941 [Schistosoma japonicum]|nr:hypothetical protein KSF78_0004941 [Schistosoma japonicum]